VGEEDYESSSKCQMIQTEREREEYEG